MTCNHLILVDDRERKPWTFDTLKYPVRVETRRLAVGDYTIHGFENKIAIEKKNSLMELCVNLSKQDRPRFVKALERLARYPVKYLVIEDCISSVPKTIASLPKAARITEASLYYWLTKIICQYKIPVIWLGRQPRMQQRVLNMFLEHVLEVDLNRKDT